MFHDMMSSKEPSCVLAPPTTLPEIWFHRSVWSAPTVNEPLSSEIVSKIHSSLAAGTVMLPSPSASVTGVPKGVVWSTPENVMTPIVMPDATLPSSVATTSAVVDAAGLISR